MAVTGTTGTVSRMRVFVIVDWARNLAFAFTFRALDFFAHEDFLSFNG
jgi:hypothetical protein